MKSLSDITASGFAGNASAFAGGGGALPQHDTTPAEALAQELAGNGYVNAVNTFLGEGAGSLSPVGTSGVVDGGRNVAIGYRAGEANTSGWQNTGVGFIALMKTTTGIYNTAIGAYTLVENTTGSNNTGVGADALWLNTAGSNNTAVGTYAGQQNTTGTNNTSLGKDALRYNTTGAGNIAVGVSALLNTVSGSDNVAIGVEAGRLNTTGANNAIFGSRAFWKSVTGDENVAFGGYTLFNANGAFRNVAIGFAALESLTSGTNNNAIGHHAGNALTTGANNTFLGHRSGLTTTTGSRNILIGNDVNASAAAASDEINIGNVIYGDRATGEVNIPGSLIVDGVAITGSGGGGSGDVTGPASASDNAIARFNGTTGKLLQNSSVRIDDDGNIGVGRAPDNSAGAVGAAIGGSGDGYLAFYDASDALIGQINATGTGSSFYLSSADGTRYFLFDVSDGGNAAFDYNGADLVFSTGEGATEALRPTTGGEVRQGGLPVRGRASGTTTVDFGAFPGGSDAKATVTGQTGILAGSRVRAWIEATATADHTADEHWLETIDVVAGDIASGAGFTIFAKNTGTLAEPMPEQWAGTRLAGPGTGINQPRSDIGGGRGTRLYGQFTVAWEWY